MRVLDWKFKCKSFFSVNGIKILWYRGAKIIYWIWGTLVLTHLTIYIFSLGGRVTFTKSKCVETFTNIFAYCIILQTCQNVKIGRCFVSKRILA